MVNDDVPVERFSKTCLGMPAKRLKDKFAWVLVGNVELRVNASHADFESDAKLEEIVKSFDLPGIRKLSEKDILEIGTPASVSTKTECES